MQPDRQWLNKAALAGGAALVLLVVSIGFYQAGRNSVLPPAPAKETRCATPNDTASVVKRNLVWRAINMDETLPDSPEKALGSVVGLMVNPQVAAEQRRFAMPMYAYKSARYFSEEEIKEIEALLNSDEPLKRAEALRQIVAFDLEAAELVHQILADKERIGLLAEGKEIPLEEVPAPSSGADMNQSVPADGAQQ